MDTDPTFTWSAVRVAYDGTSEDSPSGGGEGSYEALPDNRTFLILSNEWLDRAAGEKRYVIIHNFLRELEERAGVGS